MIAPFAFLVVGEAILAAEEVVERARLAISK
jgi:hypothetical protein